MVTFLYLTEQIFQSAWYEEAYDGEVMWCGDKENLFDTKGDGDVDFTECKRFCTENVDCVYIVFGEAVWDGKPRCALFKTCEERFTYNDGDPKVYRKVTTSKVVILIIAVDAKA